MTIIKECLTKNECKSKRASLKGSGSQIHTAAAVCWGSLSHAQVVFNSQNIQKEKTFSLLPTDEELDVLLQMGVTVNYVCEKR